MEQNFIMLMIILAQLIVVQAILAREILEELFDMEPDRPRPLLPADQAPVQAHGQGVVRMSRYLRDAPGLILLQFCNKYPPINLSSK